MRTCLGAKLRPKLHCRFLSGFQFWSIGLIPGAYCTTGIYNVFFEPSRMYHMRLPQSFTRPLSVYTLHFPIIGAMLLLLGLSVSAVAAVPQLSCTPANLRFGKVGIGQSETLTINLTNSGLTSATISNITASNPELVASALALPVVVPAGQSVQVSVTFTPVTRGWTNGTIQFTSDATNSTLALQAGGTGVSSQAVTASPSSLSFGGVAMGSNVSLPIVLTNSQSKATSITGVQIKGSTFTINGPAFPLTLAAGQSVTLTVTFTPNSTGTSGGSVFVFGPALSIPLAGSGSNVVGQLSVAPSGLNYGNVTVGTSATLPVSMSASGASVTVSSAASSNSQYSLSGASFPVTIAAGQSISLNVTFAPKNSGTVAGSVTFASNASNSQASDSLTGVGMQPQYNVNLWWNPSSGVVGYNVYRSTSPTGSYTKINSTVDANTAFTDSTVVSNNTYYYSATSVNSAGQESALSTPTVQAVVP
jgi:hypothetical protein